MPSAGRPRAALAAAAAHRGRVRSGFWLASYG
jgi:hypothetical protein